MALSEPKKRKNAPVPWKPGKNIFFGSTENSMNHVLVDQINLLQFARAEKVHGSKFKSGMPDIIGTFCGGYLALEQKFIKEIPKHSSTACIKSGHYTPGQRKFFDLHVKAILASSSLAGYEPNAYLGSLLGVLSNPRIIIGVSWRFILHRQELRVHTVRQCIEESEQTGCRFFYFEFGGHRVITPHERLEELIQELTCP